MSDSEKRVYKDRDGQPIKLLKLIRAEPEWAESQILHRDKLEKELAEARAEIERLNNKLSLLLCEDHVKSCESGLFNSKYPEDEPCLLCLIDIRQNQVEIDFKAKDAMIKQMVEALESWITRPDLKLSDSIQMTNAAVEAWRLHNENQQN